MNGSYWIKPATRTYAPSALVTWVDSVRRIPIAGQQCAVRATASSVSVAASRRRRGKWSVPFRATFVDLPAAHDWLERWSHPGQRTYVISPSASEALTRSDWWNRITEAGCVFDGKEAADNESAALPHHDPTYRIQTFILKGNPDVIRYRINGRGICWLSGRQFFDLEAKALASAVSFVPRADDARSESDSSEGWTEAAHCELWMHAMQSLVDWWHVIQGGPFGFTAGGLALAFFRSRLSPRTCLAHQHQYAKRIESHAIHGGRAQAFYLGDIRNEDGMRMDRPVLAAVPTPAVTDGPVSLYDVRSMYPWLLGDRIYPTVLHDVIENPKVPWLKSCLKEWCVIARVRLETELPEYPFRHHSGVLYPVGSFNATLAGPELARALHRGEVKTCYVACVYEGGRPFTKMSADLVRMRLESRAASNPGWEHFIKLLSNSFTGKMAQKAGQWEQRPDAIAEMSWGHWAHYDERTGKGTKLKAMADLVWSWQDLEACGRPMGASYAYLTAYGRDMMYKLRQSLTIGTVVSQDTDGIWLLDRRLDSRDRSILAPGDDPGQLAHKHTSEFARFFSAKHYVTDRGWTLSGYHDFDPLSIGATITDKRTHNPIRNAPYAPPAFTIEETRTTPMVKAAERGIITESGHVVPLRVREGRLIVPSTASPVPPEVSLFL